MTNKAWLDLLGRSVDEGGYGVKPKREGEEGFLGYLKDVQRTGQVGATRILKGKEAANNLALRQYEERLKQQTGMGLEQLERQRLIPSANQRNPNAGIDTEQPYSLMDMSPAERDTYNRAKGNAPTASYDARMQQSGEASLGGASQQQTEANQLALEPEALEPEKYPTPARDALNSLGTQQVLPEGQRGVFQQVYRTPSWEISELRKANGLTPDVTPLAQGGRGVIGTPVATDARGNVLASNTQRDAAYEERMTAPAYGRTGADGKIEYKDGKPVETISKREMLNRRGEEWRRASAKRPTAFENYETKQQAKIDAMPEGASKYNAIARLEERRDTFLMKDKARTIEGQVKQYNAHLDKAVRDGVIRSEVAMQEKAEATNQAKLELEIANIGLQQKKLDLQIEGSFGVVKKALEKERAALNKEKKAISYGKDYGVKETDIDGFFSNLVQSTSGQNTDANKYMAQFINYLNTPDGQRDPEEADAMKTFGKNFWNFKSNDNLTPVEALEKAYSLQPV